MNFALSGEQRQFAASLHDMLVAADGPAAARAWAAGNREPGLKIWRALAATGVMALAVPAESGGLGAGPVDLVIACQELGHHAIPGPVLETVAAIPALLAALGRPRDALATPATDFSSIRIAPDADNHRFVEPESMKSPLTRAEIDRWLRQLAAGELIATLAAPPVLPFAADAEAAGLVLLADQDAGTLPGGLGWACLWAGAAGPARRSVDAARSLSEVHPGRLLANGPDAGRAVATALQFGTLACAAQLLGAGHALLEATAAHARQRVQFGQPVGSFQAVKHQLADVLIKLEFAKPLLYAAAIALEHDQASAGRDVSAAKVACADSAYRAGRVALQVHGAIGYTAEHDAGLWFTKIQALRSAWGSQAEHRARVLAALT